MEKPIDGKYAVICDIVDVCGMQFSMIFTNPYSNY